MEALRQMLGEMLELRYSASEIVAAAQEYIDEKTKEKNEEATPFDKFWAAYPRRQGPNPKKPAKLKFEAAVRKGINPDLIIAAAKARHGMESREDGRFIPMASTWLFQERWDGYRAANPASPSPTNGGTFVLQGSPEWEAWEQYYRMHGRLPPSPGKYGGWTFPTPFPPSLPIPKEWARINPKT